MSGPSCSSDMPVNIAVAVLLCSGRQGFLMQGLLHQAGLPAFRASVQCLHGLA